MLFEKTGLTSFVSERSPSDETHVLNRALYDDPFRVRDTVVSLSVGEDHGY
jgi:hypothetical protein